ncbi:MAG: response regulator [Deltaproteobacteria bacterium]|nr:MAG: response regulator [Deltaproteobacteria bacterium]
MKKRILLVDDEKEFVNTLGQRLELRGYQVKTAESGEECLDFYQPEMFDIVVLDLMMPGMNGIEVLSRLKRIEKEIPVILLTGHGSTKEGEEGIKMGAADYLMKPLDIEELTGKIKEILS